MFHAIFFGVHVALTGYWVWAIFDNAEQDALEAVYLDLGSGEGLTYVKFPLPPATNRIEEEIRRRLNGGDGS